MRINRPLIIFISSFAIFVFFQTPNVNTGDGGELVTTAHYLGVAHPSGYPLYLLIAKAFIFMPIGNMAFKVALISALLNSIVLTLIYWIMMRLTGSRISAFFTITMLIQSYSFFTQSVIVKFYPLNLFFILMIFLLCLYLFNFHYREKPDLNSELQSNEKPLFLIAFIFGLILANHHTGILIAGPILIIWGLSKFQLLRAYILKRNSPPCKTAANSQTDLNPVNGRQPAGMILKVLALVLAGSLVNAYLVLRGTSKAYFNPTFIDSFGDFYAVFFRQSYGESGTLSVASNAFGNFDTYWFGLKNITSILISNFSIFSLPLLIAGCIFFFKSNIKILLFILLSIIVYGPFIARLTIGGPAVSETAYYITANQYFLPALAFYVILAGAGFFKITQWLNKHNLMILSRALPGIIACFPLIFLVSRAVDSNYRTNYVPFQIARDSYSILPVNSVFLAFGDNANYQGWYMKIAGRYREDICQITASSQNTRSWDFEGCPKAVYQNIFPAFFSKDFYQMVPLMLKGRFFGTDPIRDDKSYAAYLKNEVVSVNYLYYPKDEFIRDKKYNHTALISLIDNRQLNSDELVNPSVCLSHFTDDLFTRQLCSHYVIHLTNMARYYSGPANKKTGGKVDMQIIDPNTGHTQTLYSVDITESNRPFLILSRHIAEFNKWKLFYLRERD